jgi:hypothetical protein
MTVKVKEIAQAILKGVRYRHVFNFTKKYSMLKSIKIMIHLRFYTGKKERQGIFSSCADIFLCLS